MNAYQNDYDTFVAENIDDLKKVYQELYGEEEFNLDDWNMLDPESPLTIWYYSASDIPGQALVEEKDGRFFATMRVRDWIELNERGMLCSTEV